jgi:hypothetical protein
MKKKNALFWNLVLLGVLSSVICERTDKEQRATITELKVSRLLAGRVNTGRKHWG